MIQLLKAYETLCIQREDFSGAESVKNKIEQLMSEQLQYKRKTIAVREKEQVLLTLYRKKLYANKEKMKLKNFKSIGMYRYRL